MQTGAMTMKSRMTVTEALKERELLKKRITKKIGRLGREAGTDGAFAERRSARFDASKTGRKQAQSAVSGNIGHGAVSDGTSAHLDAALQQIRALILRYDSICSAVARSNGETWLDTSRGYMTVSEAVALRSRLNDKETADTAFEQLLTNRLESILKKQKVFSKHGQNPSGRRPALKGNVVILQNPSAGRGSAGQERGSRANAGQLKPAYPFCTGAVEAPQSDRKDSGEQGRITSGAGHEACAVKCCNLDRSVAAGDLNPPRLFGGGCKTLKRSAKQEAHWL